MIFSELSYYCAMASEVTSSTTSAHKSEEVKAQEKFKQALEENMGLKNYIERMNSECLELNAALFEEANKMVNEAKSKQHAALQLVKQKVEENEMLNSELIALKQILSEVTNDRKIFKGKSDLKSAKAGQPRIRMRSASLTPSMVKTTRKPRRDILNLLLKHEQNPNYLDSELFQDFLEWIQSGCPLDIPIREYLALEVNVKNNHPGGFNLKPIYIIHRNSRKKLLRRDSSVHSDTEDISIENDNSSQDDVNTGVSPNTLTIMYRTSNSVDLSNVNPNSFLFKLYQQDLRSCLDFENEALLVKIYNALAELALDISPLKKEQVSPYDSCPLFPKCQVKFRMDIKIQNTEKIECKISSEARDRIVAVVNLFQYLSLIKRGLASKTLQRTSPSSNDPQLRRTLSQQAISKTETEMDEQTEEVREQQFRTVQRYRLLINFARLGYGLPDLE